MVLTLKEKLSTSKYLWLQIADDTVIQKEGLENLTIQELQQACKERGMRALGLSAETLRKQLQQWLDLSQNAKVKQLYIYSYEIPIHYGNIYYLFKVYYQTNAYSLYKWKKKIFQLEPKLTCSIGNCGTIIIIT